MSNDYTDGNGYKLCIHPYWPGPAVEIATPKGTVYVSKEAALGVALDLLEKTGNTIQGLVHHANEVDAKARDSKVAEFRDSLAEDPGGSHYKSWDEISESVRELWREKYQLASKFFEKENS